MRKQSILNMYLCKPNVCTEFEMDPALVRVIHSKTRSIYLPSWLLFPMD